MIVPRIIPIHSGARVMPMNRPMAIPMTMPTTLSDTLALSERRVGAPGYAKVNPAYSPGFSLAAASSSAVRPW